MILSSNKFRTACAGLLAAALVAACSGSRGSTASAANAQAAPVPGTATLYVLNTGKPTFVISKSVVYDGRQQLVAVSESRYAVVALTPGRHVLSCVGMPAAVPAVLDAVPGQSYYLQTYMGSGAQQICGLLPPDMGAKALAKIKSAR
jgi:hypothetical protein